MPVAKDALRGASDVHVAAVATAFPSGRAPMDVKLADTRAAVAAGADAAALPPALPASVGFTPRDGRRANMTKAYVHNGTSRPLAGRGHRRG